MQLLLIGSQELLSLGIKNILEEQSLIKVIGSTADLPEATRIKLPNPPDIILLISQVTRRSELDIIRQLRAKYPKTCWCAIVPSFDTVFIPYVMQFPMQGYLSTQAERKEIIHALNLVANHQTYISPDIKQAFNIELCHPIGRDMRDLLTNLSDREAEIALLIVQGLSLEEIAAKLKIKSTTVSTYRCRIFEKCKNVQTNSGLVRLILHYNLLPLLEERQRTKNTPPHKPT